MANKGGEKQHELTWREPVVRWLPRVAGVALLLVAIAFGGERLAIKLIDPQVMQVRSVQVEGMFLQVKATEIKQVAAVFSKQGFLGVEMAVLKQAIEAMPWVKHASVRRVWPETLYISVEEQTAVAQWGDHGLVSPTGELFFPSSKTQLGEMPILFGPGSDGAQVLMQYRKVREMLSTHEMDVVRLEQDERRAWVVTLNSGVKLLLGRKESEARLARFIELYPEVLMSWERVIDEVDLRYTNGFAVRWNRASGSDNEIAQG